MHGAEYPPGVAAAIERGELSPHWAIDGQRMGQILFERFQIQCATGQPAPDDQRLLGMQRGIFEDDSKVAWRRHEHDLETVRRLQQIERNIQDWGYVTVPPKRRALPWEEAS